MSLQFGTNNPYLLFSFYDEGKKSEHSVYLRDDELKEVKYFIARDDENEGSAADDTVESMTVIAFRITPTDKNNFTKYSRSYNQEDTEDEEKNERRYISVEVRDTDEFQVGIFETLFCGSVRTSQANIPLFSNMIPGHVGSDAPAPNLGGLVQRRFRDSF